MTKARTYEFSNPSDPITLQADDDMIAACAGLLLGEGHYGITLDGRTVLPIFLLGGFQEWANEHGFDGNMIILRWREVAACLRTAAIESPPQEIRDNAERLAAWNDKKRSSMNDITARARQLAEMLETKYGAEPLAPFAEVHPRTEARDKALADLASPTLAPFALPNLYLSTGRYMPTEAKRAGIRFGFCDQAGNLKAKSEATHVGWSIVP